MSADQQSLSRVVPDDLDQIARGLRTLALETHPLTNGQRSALAAFSDQLFSMSAAPAPDPAVGLLAESMFTADRLRKRVTPDWIGMPRDVKDEWREKARQALAAAPAPDPDTLSEAVGRATAAEARAERLSAALRSAMEDLFGDDVLTAPEHALQYGLLDQKEINVVLNARQALENPTKGTT